MIELIVLDVDGTLTDGKIHYSNSGEEMKSFCVKDGLAIVSWINLGKKVAIITGRSSKIVEKRAKELQIEYIYQGVKNKQEVLDNLLKELNITMDKVASIGDDLNDYKMLKNSKFSFIPLNASPHLHKIATHKLHSKGGEGAVREMIEYLIISESLQEAYLKKWSK